MLSSFRNNGINSPLFFEDADERDATGKGERSKLTIGDF